ADFGLDLFVLRLVRENDAVFEQIAGLIESGQLAAGTKAGVDGQHAPAAQGRRQQQAAEVPGKDADGMVLRLVRQLFADLTLQARQQQASQGVLGHGLEELRVRVVL